MLSFNSGISKATRTSPFYATFGIDPNIPLWSSDFDASPTTSADTAEHLAHLRHAQSTARKIIVQNEQHERGLRQPPPPSPQPFNKHDRVWLKCHDKHSSNPKLDPLFEPAIVLHMASGSTYKVHRLDRQRRKAVTVNHTLLRPRHSPHAGDEAFPPTSRPDPSQQHIAAPPHHQPQDAILPMTQDLGPQHIDDEFVDYINAIMDNGLIAHLIPCHARRLPFLEALKYVNHAAISSNDICRLLFAGCSAAAQPQPDQQPTHNHHHPQPQQPPLPPQPVHPHRNPSTPPPLQPQPPQQPRPESAEASQIPPWRQNIANFFTNRYTGSDRPHTRVIAPQGSETTLPSSQANDRKTGYNTRHSQSLIFPSRTFHAQSRPGAHTQGSSTPLPSQPTPRQSPGHRYTGTVPKTAPIYPQLPPLMEETKSPPPAIRKLSKRPSLTPFKSILRPIRRNTATSQAQGMPQLPAPSAPPLETQPASLYGARRQMPPSLSDLRLYPDLSPFRLADSTSQSEPAKQE